MTLQSSMSSVLFQSHLEFRRRNHRLQRQWGKDRKAHIDAVCAKEADEHQEILQTFLKDNAEFSKQNTRVLVIPSGKSTLSTSESERQEIYIEHIRAIVAEYVKAPELIDDLVDDTVRKRKKTDEKFDKNPGLESFCDSICAICKGGCCTSGKDHAYLSMHTIKRFMNEHPELVASQIVDLYLSYLVPESIENSCINHTATGCALPRELRSDICNGYYCDSLTSYQNNVDNGEVLSAVLLIQRASTTRDHFDPNMKNPVTHVELILEKTYLNN